MSEKNARERGWGGGGLKPSSTSMAWKLSYDRGNFRVTYSPAKKYISFYYLFDKLKIDWILDWMPDIQDKHIVLLWLTA
jgi:hypothetical protein